MSGSEGWWSGDVRDDGVASDQAVEVSREIGVDNGGVTATRPLSAGLRP